ncbi:MAG: DNA repair exonuclease [Bryobacteraceae bacterium]|nr:DNA repair exonuclease [Bryobacteraceae bacterium]
MGVRFLHTADWQIGMNAAHTGRASQRVREARFGTARRLAETAAQEHVDFAVLAGDTFENHAVSLSDVERTAEILALFPCPVFVLPGNHDPAGPGSVWELPVWRTLANVRILDRAEPCDVGEAVLFPCPLSARWSGHDPTAWIPAGPYADRIRIGIAHGTLDCLPSADRAHPIPEDAAWLRRLDYLALGDWHSERIFGDGERGFRMAYSGTPEPTRFGEDASGRALIVEIEAPRALPRLYSVETAQLVWLQREHEILHPGQLAEVKRELEALQGQHVLLTVRLRGTLPPEDAGLLEELRQLEAGFLFFRLEESGLVSALDLSLHEVSDPVVREALARLARQSQEGPEQDAARLAMQTLLRLAKGAGA